MPALFVKMNKQMVDIWKIQDLKKVRLVGSLRACEVVEEIGKIGIQIPKTRSGFKNREQERVLKLIKHNC